VKRENKKVGRIYPLISIGQCSDKNMLDIIKLVPHPSPAMNLPSINPSIDVDHCIITPPNMYKMSAINTVGFLPIASDTTPEHNAAIVPPKTRKLANA
jgi:hypothetical protein